MNIVHIVTPGGFASGYINFMKSTMSAHNHTFVTSSKNKQSHKLSLVNYEHVILTDGFRIISQNRKIMKAFQEADLIIASGVFLYCMSFLARLPKHIMKKVFLNLWGGDFYFLRGNPPLTNIRWHAAKALRMRLFSECGGILFGISGEEEIFQELTKIDKPCFLGPMPPDTNAIDAPIKRCRMKERAKGPIRVQLGNSATETNQHMEAIDWLSRYKGMDMEIFAPLSYGSDTYRDKVIEYGTRKLGGRFHPILEYMDKEKYIEFLSTIDVAIFNNNRQQGFTNISLLLALGKKIYLRTDTTMWSKLNADGYSVFPIDEIAAPGHADFTQFDADLSKKNKMIYDEEFIKKFQAQWEDTLARIPQILSKQG